MKAQIIKRANLDIPSASDVEVIDGLIYLVGDDSPYLYCLDQEWKLVRKQLLFETDQFSGGRMQKAIKPDFEAMTALTYQGRSKLLIFGSGSRSPQRDVCFVVDLPDPSAPAAERLPVQQVALTALYDVVRGRPDVVGTGLLNLEAAAATNSYVILYQRGNITGNNVALYYALDEFMAYLLGSSRAVPTPTVFRFNLPLIGAVRSGFSGACLMPDEKHILFSAAVENTTNEIDDGETLGSFLGVVSAPADSFGSAQPVYALLTLDERGETYQGKIESVAVLNQRTLDNLTVLAATDDDKGGSEILLIEIG